MLQSGFRDQTGKHIFGYNLALYGKQRFKRARNSSIELVQVKMQP